MKKKISPKMEHQTIHPAKQRRQNMKTNDIRTPHPRAASKYCQLLVVSVMKLAKSPCEKALATVELVNSVLNILALGTHNLSIKR